MNSFVDANRYLGRTPRWKCSRYQEQDSVKRQRKMSISFLERVKVTVKLVPRKPCEVSHSDFNETLHVRRSRSTDVEYTEYRVLQKMRHNFMRVTETLFAVSSLVGPIYLSARDSFFENRHCTFKEFALVIGQSWNS